MLTPEHLAPILISARLGKAGLDLFCHKMPSEITKGLVVMGDLAGSEIDHELVNWRIGQIQVILRDTDHASGLRRARAVMDALTVMHRDLPPAGGGPGIRLRRLRPIHDPIVYPRSEGDVLEFSLNFEAIWIVLT
jgi:hypothetical protein